MPRQLHNKGDNSELISIKIIILISFGIFLRFFAMSMGHNYDFESYQIVGEIVGRGGNVYAETTRYNYGFIFFLIQGLGYSISAHFPEVTETMYRIYIVSVLTMADVGIALFLQQKYGHKAAFLFFLNPISIIITGYHNQFDNIAVLLALLAVESMDVKESFSGRDVRSITLFAASLITKHITAFFFIWMLFNTNFSNYKKKIAYSCLPPAVFLVSFVPFGLLNDAAREGILNNVFFYRSYNNYPLLSPLLTLLKISDKHYFLVFVGIIVIVGWLIRRADFEFGIMQYLASLVAFSSAIANQYLSIPLALLESV